MVRPILEYGSQVITYHRYFLRPSIDRLRHLHKLTIFEETLEKLQTKALKTIIGCPKSTSPTIVRLFSGVEPLICRFEILKLRYFWKLPHLKDRSITSIIFRHRRNQFLSTKNGFIHEVFNLCCKYDAIEILHGKLKGLSNPASYIKNKVVNFNLRKDLEVGRRRPYAFRDIYLSNIVRY